MEKLVSIVVALYNVEKFAGECIDSILAQTYKNLEIFLIDDGSTDSTAQICDEYSNTDIRIKVIHKKNGGLTSVRKYGFDNASGEYIFFADGDDKLASNAIELLLKSCIDNDSDIAVCGYYIWNGDCSEVEIEGNCTVIEKKDFENFIILPLVSRMNDNVFVPCYCWNRLFKKKSLSDSCFISERICRREDAYLNLKVLDNIQRISVVNNPLYYYRINPDSLTLKFLSGRLEKDMFYIDFLRDYLFKRGIVADERLNYLYISTVLSNIDNFCKQGSFNYFKDGMAQLYENDVLSSSVLLYKKYIKNKKNALSCFLFNHKLYRLLYLYRKAVVKSKGLVR